MSQYIIDTNDLVVPSKVDVPNLVTYRDQTPLCNRYAVWCVSKKCMCLKETKDMIIILGSMINMIQVGGTYMTI